MFSMTSLGANIDESINNGRGPYIFKISGQLYHWIGSLCPAHGEPPRFLQLYIYDTDNEVDNRLSHYGGDNSTLRRDIVEGLIDLLDSHNALVQLFRTVREKLQDTHVPNFKVRLYNVVGVKEYELPTGDMLGAIVYETGPEKLDMDVDIVLENVQAHPKRIDVSQCCTSFPGIRTVNSIVHPTCRSACEALDLLQDDREWEVTLTEAALSCGHQQKNTCERKIILAVASSGIASLLLPAGQTAHSRFKIPLDLTDTMIRNTRDILNELDHLFGGKTVMLGGDFKQTLPVKRSASRDEIIRSSIANSYLWRHFKIHYLLENMRLNNESLSEVDKDRTTTFVQWLLNIGNGQIGIPDDSDLDNTSWVDIPNEYCIPNDDNGIPNLINFIYDEETLRYPSAHKLQEKAIICPKNDTADMINNTILSLLTTTTRTYLSYDDAIPHTHDGGEIELLYPKEYLNSLSFPGLPPYNLTLKVGSPIMLMATSTYPDTIAASKGKMIAVEPKIADIASLKPTDSNKSIEVIVYRKWVSKYVHTRQPIRFCCMLIDKQGTPIQANMDAKDTNYFEQLLQLHNAYRITSGNIIQLALWHEMALEFNVKEYEKMEKPVVIAVSSYWVRHFNGLQISGTSATHYYLNPNILETNHIKEQYQQLSNTVPVLNINNQRHEDLEQEKFQNRFPLATLLEVNPQNYQGIQTQYARIMDLNQLQHIGDGSGTISLTCFSNEANSLVKDCTELLNELPDKNPYQLPLALKELEGTTHTFQFHFDINSTLKRKVFILDTVFTNIVPPLLTPPAEYTVPKPISTELPTAVMRTETCTPALSRTASNEFEPQQQIRTPLQQSPTSLGQPEDPMKNQEEEEPVNLPQPSTKEEPSVSADIQASQSTPPEIKNLSETHKGNQPSNHIQLSAQKALFQDAPEPARFRKKQSPTSENTKTMQLLSTISLSPRQMALWTSQREDHTSDWLRTVPISRLGQTMNACSKVFVGDIYGDHAVSCAGIICIKHSHNVVRDTLVNICYRSRILAGKEVDIGLDGGRDKPLRPADMLLYSWDGGLDLLELEADAVTLLKRIQKFSMTQDIGTRSAVHIFNRISLAITKGVEAQIVSRLPSNLL
ncbi:DNA helicase [Tanacetum coccineum]